MTGTNGRPTRRQVLAALGAAGAGAVSGAALDGDGTLAFLGDEETFEDDRLVSGSLDLKVAWQEYYADWSDDEAAAVSDLAMPDDGAVPDGYVGLPTDRDPVVAVPESDLDAFQRAAAVEAYPDPADDGRQGEFAAARGGTTGDGVGYVCRDGADAPADLNPLPGSLDPQWSTGLRTASADTVAGTLDDPDGWAPLVDLVDVKPGDFGVLTLDLHLCGNPGWIWLTGGFDAVAENGCPESERRAAGERPGVVELASAVRTAVWYDGGDGHPRGDELVFRGTLAEAMAALSAPGRPGLLLDGDPSTPAPDCFGNSTTRTLGFAWWLPADIGGEIQTDSVSFDLGFYTEQCRHNPRDRDGFDGVGGAISFLAFCVDESRGVSPSAIDPAVTAVLARDEDGPTAVRWATDVGVDRVVAFYGSPAGPRVTAYAYDSPTTGDVASTGDETDDGGATVTTRDAVLPGDARDPCPDGFRGVKLEWADGGFVEVSE